MWKQVREVLSSIIKSTTQNAPLIQVALRIPNFPLISAERGMYVLLTTPSDKINYPENNSTYYTTKKKSKDKKYYTKTNRQ